MAPPSPARGWTRIEDYLGAMANRRTARRLREPLPKRTQPEFPRALLSTVPFLALICALGLLTIGIAMLAWPGGRTPPRAEEAQAAADRGTALPGWFENAQRDMR